MKKAITVLLLLSASILMAQTGEKNFIDQNYIEVTGKAEMEITPDEIFIRIQIREADYKGKKLAEMEKAMSDKLTELGIDISNDLKIKDLLSGFQNYWLIKDEVSLTKEYQLLVHDAATAGKVFLELQKLNISRLSIVRVDNSKITDYRKEVKIAAIKAAREKAKALAMAVNQDIGRAIYIQEIEPAIGMYRSKAEGFYAKGVSNTILSEADASESNAEFEKIHLEYSMIVRFELK